MFGIIRPCRHRLGELATTWQAHLCGMCLSLRDDHGQAARLATNYDGLVISVLAEAQADTAPERRTAGRCALRGMRKADVAIGDCARLAATVSLVLAAAKLRDHADDGDGMAGRPGARGAATALAARWTAASERTGRRLGFEVGVLTEAVGRQVAVEEAAGPGTSLLTVTEPTETATAAAFAHTAVLAGQPGNAGALAEAGRLFGRIAHLVDAVEDLEDDRASGTWNPLLATGTDLAEARRLCDDALLGIKLALGEAVFTDDRLVRSLLVRELKRSVHRTFARATRTSEPSACPHRGAEGHHGEEAHHGAETHHAADATAIAGAGASAGPGVSADATAVAEAGAGGGTAPFGCGLAAAGATVAGLTGMLTLRRRRLGCCDGCCCECGEEACCECSCDCCCDACGDGCCDCG